MNTTDQIKTAYILIFDSFSVATGFDFFLILYSSLKHLIKALIPIHIPINSTIGVVNIHKVTPIIFSNVDCSSLNLQFSIHYTY